MNEQKQAERECDRLRAINAELLAALMDLHAAMRTALRDAGQSVSQAHLAMQCPEAQAARAAIAKAEQS